MKKRVFITGVTGTMGLATVKEFYSRCERFELSLLVRDSPKNRQKLRPFADMPGLRIVWGDLMRYDDVAKGAADADYILHIGGMVSPAADYFPEKTMEVNVTAAENVARAAREGNRAESVKVVYIGSIAQLGDRRPPCHWGRTGDTIAPSRHDAYALSKVVAERAIVDSGLKHWVALRQTGILCPELLLKGSDPITFHVPLRGVLEWTTAEDSGRLMANICEDSVPDSFWNRFYNIGSGESYRLTNYEFESKLLRALGVPPPEKIFEPRWFALKNFHGQWWSDSDELERIVPFRSGISCEEYFESMKRRLPLYFRLAPLAPAPLVKWGMKRIALHRQLGTLGWIRHGNSARIESHFGSIQDWEKIGSWSEEIPSIINCVPERAGQRTPDNAKHLSHGYDETKPLDELSLADMKEKANFMKGECISEEMKKGDLSSPLLWRCSKGHIFKASPALVLLGGHWCPECLEKSVK